MIFCYPHLVILTIIHSASVQRVKRVAVESLKEEGRREGEREDKKEEGIREGEREDKKEEDGEKEQVDEDLEGDILPVSLSYILSCLHVQCL